ncbi:MAG TPA: T9SS type A sorting domain-containing protein [Puia sp.]|jgi:hypothetical protein|nr:T9SS type A sorting domain-containing protein [Puia sp.]
MKMKFTLLTSCLFFLLLNSGTAFAQANGDYRSAATGDWNTAATWETFNAGSWGAAATPPPVGTEAIEVRSPHTVTVSTATTINNVLVDAGSTLDLNGNFSTTLNSLGLTNNGTVLIENHQTLSGAGTFTNNGVITVTVSSVIGVTAFNNGTVNFSQISGVQTNTLTNNNLINWVDGNLFLLGGATVVNNDSIAIQATGSVSISTDATGTLTNAAGGIIYLVDPSLVLSESSAIAFTNNGTVKGVGTVAFAGTTAGSNGTVSPGNGKTTSGVLTTTPTIAITGTPTFELTINPGGGTPTAGTTYSQLGFTTTTNISGATLTVVDNGHGDPTTTVYTLVTSAGNITGTFAAVNLPATLGNLTYNSNNVTVERIVLLPLTWGSFTVTADGDQAHLSWTTLQESNTSHFTIQRSTDGVNFAPIGTVTAKGNSSSVSSYSFTDVNPNLQGFDYYRLAETDLDGKSNFSLVRVVNFGKGKAVIVQTSPNPVRDMLNIVVQEDNITILLNDMSGKVVKTMRLAQGFHQTSLSDLPGGVYQLTIVQGQNKIDSRQILKL